MTIDSGLETSTNNSISILSNEDEQDFQQWKNSISIEIRMSGGLSSEQRQKIWISLAKKYIQDIHLDWNKTLQFAFNQNSYPEDEQLNNQITKDLHRTGCNWSSNEKNRIILQRVLLAFARYNKSIGYCQGLHILTSIILDVVDMNEESSLIILIYLIDFILPDLFSNNLNGLAIDITVFDRWLKIHNSQLHKHLEKLQSNNNSELIYEPPLLNVFTIQWFLTLFSTCLPRQAMLRVWDVLMIEGSEVLFRTGLILWSKLTIPVLKVSTADQFYSAMAHLSIQLLDEKIIIADNLIQDIYNLGQFPTPILSELRQKYTMEQISDDIKMNQSIGQITNDSRKSIENVKQSKTKLLDDDIVNFISCFAILSSTSRNSQFESLSHKRNSPDINQLRQQYKKFKQRNQQVQIIIQSSNQQQQSSSESVCSISNGPLINHLFVKPNDTKRNQMKRNVSTKSLLNDETEDIQKEFQQLITCLHLEKSTNISYEQSKETSQKNTFEPFIKSQIPKYSSFNPFPSRSFNENVAVNGYKLGLYSPVLTTR